MIRIKQGEIKWGPDAHSTGNLLKPGVVIGVDEEQRSFAAWLKKLAGGFSIFSSWQKFVAKYAKPIPGSYASQGITYTGSASRI